MKQQTADEILEFIINCNTHFEAGQIEAIKQILNSLVSKDEIGCECDCCRGDHARIAKRSVNEFVNSPDRGFEKMTAEKLVFFGAYCYWLDKESEGC